MTRSRRSSARPVIEVAGQRFHYDAAEAERVCRFFERVLVLPEGRGAGEPFRLEPWQRELLSELFGWRREDGTRRYRVAYISVPRKNGKSTLAAGIALYMLTADGEHAPRVYSAAADREQARIVYGYAREMIALSAALRKRCQPYRSEIRCVQNSGTYRALSADAPRKHGLNASCVIVDELHALPTRELWDVLLTSTAARRQPLVVAITTAGWDRTSVAWEVYQHARAVLAGEIEDPSFYAFIREAAPEDDWTDPEVWRKANPSLGRTLTLDYLREECERAKAIPAYQNAFRTLHLNQWVEQDTRWISVDRWDACREEEPPELEGRPCFGGLDLSSSTDLSAFALVFPPLEEGEPYRVRVWYWLPEAGLRDRVRRDRVPYDAWARDGWIELTDGDWIDHRRIVQRIRELSERYRIVEIAFDRWGAQRVQVDLQEAGLRVVGFGQGFAAMSGPSKEFERLVLSREIAHDGNPIMRFNVASAAVRTDPAGNIKPDKQRSSARIDGLVATIMALDRAMAERDERELTGRSIYEEADLFVL